MNAADILKYGHLTVMKTIDGFTQGQRQVPGVCGVWSVKDILAHLASFEHILAEVQHSFLEGGSQPTLDRHLADRMKFNDLEVAARQGMSWEEVLAEYQEAHQRNKALVARIPEAELRQAGRLPWYGMEYALDDFIVYQFYGHKREHCAQIDVYRDQMSKGLTASVNGYVRV